MAGYVSENTPYNYKVNFVVDGRAVTPASAIITLKNNAGDVIGGIEDTPLTITTGATSAEFVVTAANNVPTLAYELRYLTVQFVYQSKTYILQDYYTLRHETSFVIPVTPDEVRALVGLEESELPDSNIDIFAAYDRVNAAVTGNSLEAIFTSGSSLIPVAQQAIRISALLASVVSFDLMMMQSEQSDNTNYKRFAGTNFNEIMDNLRAELAALISQLNGEAAVLSPTIFQVVTGTDPVTGA